MFKCRVWGIAIIYLVERNRPYLIQYEYLLKVVRGNTLLVAFAGKATSWISVAFLQDLVFSAFPCIYQSIHLSLVPPEHTRRTLQFSHTKRNKNYTSKDTEISNYTESYYNCLLVYQCIIDTLSCIFSSAPHFNR